jgi:predicted esterase
MVGERTPHSEQSLLSMGAPPAEADAAVVALHGRGATARSILRIVAQLGLDDVAGVAPQASRNTWYPTGFMEPTEKNEPWLSAALSTVGETVASVEEAGVPVDRTVLLGFSQGACLASEFVARNARRYGGLVAFSGGLVGPPGTPREYEGPRPPHPARSPPRDGDGPRGARRRRRRAHLRGDGTHGERGRARGGTEDRRVGSASNPG